MTAHPFPYTPDDPDGIWTCAAPADASIGEVIVYAQAAVVPLPEYEGNYLLMEQSNSAVSGADWIGRTSNLSTEDVLALDVQLLVRLHSLTDRVALWSLDEQANIMAYAYVDAGMIHVGYMEDWSPFTVGELSAALPGSIDLTTWFWVRVELDAGTITLYWSPDYAIPVWSSLDAGSVTGDEIPVRPSFGDSEPFNIGWQVTGDDAEADLDIRQVRYTFNANAVVTSTFEDDATVVGDTITDDNGVAWGKHASMPASIEATP